MKLTTLLIILSIVQVSGKAFSQITLRHTNIQVTAVLHEIETQSGYVFIYNEDKTKFGNISINLVNASIDEALKVCFKNTDLTYRIVDKNIVLRTKETVAEPLKYLNLSAQPILVIGQVTNSGGQPLSGASVLLKRNKKGVTTDAKGRYVLKIAEATDTLLYSYLGYQTKVVPMSDAIRNSSLMDVILTEATNQMDEMIIQGYGKTSQRLATGNITRVSGAELAQRPVMNPILALQGKVPGVVITATTGSAAAPIKVEIRGRKALNTNFPSDPLYIVNGVPLTVLEVNGSSVPANSKTAVSRGYDQTGEGLSPFFSMNPDDIESIEVLKDADATAIYGSRGANGVILITTKKGMPGKTNINFSVDRGVNFATKTIRLLNTEEYLSMRREAFDNSGITPNKINAYDLLSFDQHRYTDWQKYTLGANSRNNVHGSISGGSELTTYRISTEFANTNDLNTIRGKNQMGSFGLSLHNQSSNGKLSMDLDASYALTTNDAVKMDYIITLPPNAPDPFDEQGNLNYAAWGSANGDYPFLRLKDTDIKKGNSLTSSLGINYSIVKGLSASVRGGYNNSLNLNTILRPIAGLNPYVPGIPYGNANFSTTRVNNAVIEPQLNYNTLISRLNLSVLAGGTYQINTTSGATVRGDKYTDDALLQTITNAGVVTATDSRATYKYAGVFARINFNWADKYILNFNGRRDGSSRFGLDSRFGNFYSIGAAYNISDELWAKNILPQVISHVKLRGSYGITGSDAVGDYKYLTQYGNGNQPDYNGISPISPQIQPNADYHWQVNRSAEAGLDVGFFKDRLVLQVSAYRSACDNQLVDFRTPVFTGFGSVIANSPAKVVNDGLEFLLRCVLIQREDFNWTVNLNTGLNRNRLVSYPNLEKSPYASQYKLGQSVSNEYLFNYTGVDPLTGNYTFEDYNQDGQILAYGGVDNKGDRYISVKTVPDFTGNMNHSFTYKGFTLGAGFYIVKQMGKNYLYTDGVNGHTNISYERYINRWQKPGDQTLTAKLTTVSNIGNSNIDLSTQGYTDASFIRLNSLYLAGNLPSKLSSRLGVTNLNVSLSASNLFVLTKYKGLDPEVQNFGGSAPVRTVTMGLNCSF